MAEKVEFYFDFMSPYAYLAHQRLPELAGEYGYEIQYYPIDLEAAKRAAGNTGPPNVKIPVKIRYLLTDLERWAERYKTSLAFPPSLNTARLNKGFFYAQDRDLETEYVGATWKYVWGKGLNPESKSVLAAISERFDWELDEFLSYIHSTQASFRFDKSNAKAQTKGVFGVPTMIIDDHMWWGNDRLEFVEEYMRESRKRA